MSTIQRILLFFILPLIAPLLFPINILSQGFVVILLAGVLFFLLGILLTRGYSTALTLSIFLQGLNVIVRLMMLFPRATYQDGSANFSYLIASSLSIALSMFILLRLDKVDVRRTMIR